MSRKEHWEAVYTARQSAEVSWYQARPARAAELLRRIGAGPHTDVIDVGGGDSTFVDTVVAERLGRVTVLDISAGALDRARARLGERATEVTWIEADVTQVALPPAAFDVWHDRAVFHFLVEPEEQARYVATATEAVRGGGHLVMATFAPEGPPRCSGLEVVRYGPDDLARRFAHGFALVEGFSEEHVTPKGVGQRFTVALLRRR